MRLVGKIAHQHTGTGMPLLDLIQEGSMGLMKAVQRFDSSRGHKFSGFASTWIRQHIGTAIRYKSRVVHIPSSIHNSLPKLHNKENELVARLGKMPTEAAIAEALSIDMRELAELRQARGDVQSLDAVLYEGEYGDIKSLAQFTRYEGEFDTETASELLATRDQIEDMLHDSVISERERLVSCLRFGYDSPSMHGRVIEGRDGQVWHFDDLLANVPDSGYYALSQIGVIMGISRSQASKLASRAVRHLHEHAVQYI